MAGLEDVALDPGEQKHADLEYFEQHPELERPFRFAFVRHPICWYRSFFSYQQGLLWEPIPYVPLYPPKDIEYVDFLKWVLDNHAGFLGRLYEKYVGSSKNPIEFIGNVRSLRMDLAKALAFTGHRVPWRLIDTIPHINVSPEWVMPSVENAIVKAERDLCVRFGFL